MTKATLKAIGDSEAVYVNKMFNKIAPTYDLLNNLMTFGLHYKWKTEMIKLVQKEIDTPSHALDLCSGTGDLAIILNKYYPDLNITCMDNSHKMLDIAKLKIQKLKTNKISFSLLDFEDINYDYSSFDLITIGFGLRNLINKEKCIEQVYKLLATNGVFACIDLGHPHNPIWQEIYFNYFFKVVPLLGQIVACDKAAYTYLPESLHTWYKQKELKELILRSGFTRCYFKDILGGAVAIHIAVK